MCIAIVVVGCICYCAAMRCGQKSRDAKTYYIELLPPCCIASTTKFLVLAPLVYIKAVAIYLKSILWLLFIVGICEYRWVSNVSFNFQR